MLEHLALHANEVVGRAELTEHVWEAAHEPLSNTIDVCVQRLRRKIDASGQPSLIVTRRSEGYMLSVERDRDLVHSRTPHGLVQRGGGVVLIAGAAVVAVVQDRLSHQRLDEELARLMLTLQGVMRTEFGEGLDLQASADEASIEVVAPDRTLVLTQPDGRLLAVWGRQKDAAWRPPVPGGRTYATVDLGGESARAFIEHVTDQKFTTSRRSRRRCTTLRAESPELRRALAAGVAAALIVALLGGWLVGRQTLKPLGRHGRTGGVDLRGRTARRGCIRRMRDDELGRLAQSFNGLLDRLGRVLHAQRQFMADASHELRTPVSVVRTTAQVALSSDDTLRQRTTASR